MNESKEVKARRLKVSHEDMEGINRTLEVCKRLKMPEHEINDLRNRLIEVYGEEVKQ